MMNSQSKKITGGVLAGLLAGILVGYFLGIGQSKTDEKFLSQWVKENGDYDDGNVFGYETTLPDNYHDKVKQEKLPRKKKSVK